ncbi:hypothetical protein FB451DRAFT_33503 [Mycena latifolia]|nr:hypothetical protein FB451DRAFT_33503 [Mycena latifolia]
MAAFSLDLTLGPIINGAFFTVFFFGLICMQTINYMKLFPNDIWLIKFTVIFLWILELVYTACICHGAYTMSVTDFGELFTLLYTPWGLNVGVVIGSLIDHSVQDIQGHWRIVPFDLSMVLRRISSRCLFDVGRRGHQIGFHSFVGQKWKWLLTLLFFGDAGLDILNACVLCFYLKVQSRTTFSRSTVAVLDQLVVYTLQTGLATSFVALGAAVAFRVAPEDYIWTTFFMAMPGSFLSALLANINNRKSLSQPGSAVTSSANNHGLGQGGTIQFTRNIVYDIAPASQIKTDTDGPDSLVRVLSLLLP